MPNLGSLWYTMGIKDLTDADLKKINNKLKSAGAEILVTPKLAKSLSELMPKGFSVDVTINKIAQEALDRAIEGKVMRAEVLPLVDKLRTAVTDALKDHPVSIGNLSIQPEKLSAAVSQALTSANFTSIGDKAGEELGKALAVKVNGQKYEVSVSAKTDKLASGINAALSKIESKELKLKFDRSTVKEFRNELVRVVSENIKVTPAVSLTQEALQRAAEGKVLRVEILPLVTHLRKALLDATAQSPVQMEVGVKADKLRNLVTSVLTAQGYMVSIGTVTGLDKAIDMQLRGRTYNVTIHANANEITRSVQASLMQVQSRYFGLQVSKDVLRDSIDQALMGKPFNIQIAVMQDQARRAVQNALNNARMVGKDDALAYQRLQTGELRAAQAELARLKAAHMGAADAAKAHASASINLGGAMGSNIKIAGELGSAMASLYSIHAAKQFLSQVIEIGGELEHQKIALQTIYGSESKMESLYGQIKGLARQSPFGVMDLTKNIKQLSAYGVAYNEVYDTAKRLADISAATSVDINRLILAFGKTKNRTFLDGLEAKQFAYANIPIYDALSKKLTELEGKFVSVKDVMGRIKKREIGFDMVKEILWDMTDEGGKFYNMQEKLAGSVKTSWKLVRDNIELMFGEIAESGVGEALKNLGQTAQELTRSWKAFSAILAAGGIAFGVYKLAIAGVNALLDKETASIAANHLAEKQRQATKLRAIGLSSTLSAREKELIATRNRLTATDLEYLYVEKNLDRIEMRRLFLAGKITRAELQKAVALGVLTQKQFEQVAGTTALTGALSRFKATLNGTWSTIKMGAAQAFGMIFNWATAAFAAIAGLTYLYQHNQREYEIADNFSKSWKQTGEDMGKSISESLAKPFKNLSAPEASQLIDEYKNLIKDFAALPDDMIQRAIYDENGNIRSTADQIKYLREQLESLQETAESMSSDMGTIIGATGDGWFKEDIVTNLKDYSDAYNKANSIYLKFVTEHKEQARSMVEAARQADAGFAQEIATAKTLAEQFAILMRNRGKFTAGWNAAQDEVGYWATRGGSFLGSFKLWDTSAMEASVKEAMAYQQAMEDTQSAIASFKELHEDWNWADLSASQAEEVRQCYNKLVEASELSAPELKRTVADTFEEAFKVKITPDKTEEAWVKNVKDAMGKCADEGTKEALRVLQIDGAAALTAAQRELIAKLFKAADEETKKQLPDLFNNAQSWINQHTLFWRIQYYVDSKEGKMSQALQDIIASKGGTKELSAPTTDLLKEVDKEGASTWDIRNALQEKRQAAKNKMDADIQAGLKKTSKTFLEDKTEYDRIEKALKELDWTDLQTKDQKSNKHSKGSQKDEFAESLKQRFKDIKDAWSEFQKWSKTEGREAAAIRIGESGLFSTLPKDKIPQTVEQYRALVVKLENELRSAGVKGTAREGLLNDLLKQLLDIDKTVVDEQLKLALDKVSKEAERQLADWSLFDKIRKATGNQDLAMSIAFGLNVKGETDYPTMIKQQLQKTVDAAENALSKAIPKEGESPYEVQGYNYEKLKELYDARETDKGMQAWMAVPEEIRNAWEKANGDILKYFDQQRDAVADIVAKYQSVQDKIAKIDFDRDEEIRKVNESDTLSPKQKAQTIQRINVEADYQKFTQSADYLKFFSGIYALTMQQAQEVGDKIRLHLDQRLQAGKISAEEYYKEIERINQQLTKLRNVKSDAMTFMTGGVKGLNQKKLEKADSDVLDQMTKVQEAQETLEEAKASGNEKQIAAAQIGLSLAENELKKRESIRDAIVKDMEAWEKVAGVVNIIGNIAGGMSDAFNTLRDMAAAYGFDTENNAWQTAEAAINTLTTVTSGVQKVVQSAMSGDIGGILSGAFDTLLTPFTIWNKLHDAKLQKMIERSQEAAQIMQNQYDILEKRMANFLGNAANMKVDGYSGEGGAYGKQRELMQGQLAELEKQRQAEMDKKKSDDSVVEDYNKQIEEMKISIQDFAIEAANAVYGIDLNGWAEQLSDSLVDAFAAGEDAAEAFDKTVGDIMRDVTSKMISQDILAPMFGDLRNFLFGENGMSGAFGADFKLDASEMAAMKTYLDKIKDEGIPAAEELFNAINEATGGILNETDTAKSGLSAGIQSVTEDTADLLASYLNSIRADVSLQTYDYWARLLNDSLPQISVIAQSQLAAQRQIAENTLRNAVAAEAIVKSNDEISRLLTRVTQGGAKFYVN